MKRHLLFLSSFALLLAGCGNPSSRTSSSDPSSSRSSGSTSSSITSSSSESSSSESSSSESSSSSFLDESSSSKSSPSSRSSSSPTVSHSSVEDVDYVRVFAPAKYTRIWAWNSQGNLFPSWPGDALESFDSDWKTYSFPGQTSMNLIFSIDGQDQTKDLKIEAAGNWWYYQGQWYDDWPDAASSSSSSEFTSMSIPASTAKSKGRTYYQLLVYSFADGNNDGIGDFKGLVEHLDYLQKLGIGGIWLSPIHNADSYHGYDVKDYYSVNSQYEVGGVTFDTLLQECHNRDIQVVMDMVFNHTSKNHPWRSQHSDWYSGEYIFGGGMPDLNYDKPALREEIKNICHYWLGKGVDGFRCDAAAWIYGGGNGWSVNRSDFAKSVSWWKEFASYLKGVKPDVYLVGEVYTELQYIEQFYASGMTAFNFSSSYWAKDTLDQKDSEHKWVEEVVAHQAHVRAQDNGGLEASFLSNHDVGRFTSKRSEEEELKFANALNVLSPGCSYIYYGDELGLTGVSGGWQDMSYRTPMPFASGTTNSEKYLGNSGYSTIQSQDNADMDANANDSIFAYTAKAVAIKNANQTLYNGIASKLETGLSSCGALQMKGETKTYAIIVNAATVPAEVRVEGAYEVVGDLSTSGSLSIQGQKLTLPRHSIALIKGEVSLSAKTPN